MAKKNAAVRRTKAVAEVTVESSRVTPRDVALPGINVRNKRLDDISGNLGDLLDILGSTKKALADEHRTMLKEMKKCGEMMWHGNGVTSVIVPGDEKLTARRTKAEATTVPDADETDFVTE